MGAPHLPACLPPLLAVPRHLLLLLLALVPAFFCSARLVIAALLLRPPPQLLRLPPPPQLLLLLLLAQLSCFACSFGDGRAWRQRRRSSISGERFSQERLGLVGWDYSLDRRYGKPCPISAADWFLSVLRGWCGGLSVLPLSDRRFRHRFVQ